MCIKISTFIIKYTVFLFNVLCAISGIALLVMGIMSKIWIDDSSTVEDNSSLSVGPIITITVGAAITIVALFGCFGAVKENVCLLSTYGAILVCLLILQSAAGIYSFVIIQDREAFTLEIQEDFMLKMESYGTDMDITEYIDNIQTKLQCCGAYAHSDWDVVPASCRSGQTTYKDGCGSKIADDQITTIETIGALSLGLSAVEIFATIFAFCLATCIKKERRKNYDD